jgi:hypothetical protein
MSEYLLLAKKKYEQSNDVNFSLNFIDFVADCYVRLKPCSYGCRIQKKITDDFGLKSVPAKENRGDFTLGDKYGEIKTSFLDKGYSYNLTHLRFWQKFNYYLLCFIDCEDNFKPEFYLLDKYVLNQFKLTPMNGTRESNGENNNIELRITIKKNSDSHYTLKKYNKLNGNTFNDLMNYVKEKNVII